MLKIFIKLGGGLLLCGTFMVSQAREALSVDEIAGPETKAAILSHGLESHTMAFQTQTKTYHESANANVIPSPNDWDSGHALDYINGFQTMTKFALVPVVSCAYANEIGAQSNSCD